MVESETEKKKRLPKKAYRISRGLLTEGQPSLWEKE